MDIERGMNMSYERELREWRESQREIKMDRIAPKNTAFEKREDSVAVGIAFMFAAWLFVGAVVVAAIVNYG
jgi:hypothetical protein